MKIRHNQILIPEQNPFYNCKLERQEYGNVLTKIVNTYSDGFVLAINNEWGTGKTTFVKMWQQHLNNEKFETIYFNAWENDFDSNPLIAIIAELKKVSNSQNEKIFKGIIKNCALLAKNVVPTLFKAFANKYIDSDSISAVIEKAAKGATEIFEKEIEEFCEKKSSILDFRSRLEEFLQKRTSNRPLVFIIDELDRCRPSYAVEILEQIKHLFTVKGIVFVLSIDKQHLSASVKGFYGSEQINTEEYLRRFIDLEYSIPTPSITVFCNYLYSFYEFESFFSSDQRSNYSEYRYDKENFIRMAEVLFKKSKATLRQQEKVFAKYRLVLSYFSYDNNVVPHLLFFLTFIQIFNNSFYNKIQDQVLTLQDVIDEYSICIPNDISETHDHTPLYVLALLLELYNKSRSFNSREELLSHGDDGKDMLMVRHSIKSNKSSTNLISCLKYVQSQTYKDSMLNSLLDKVNLMHNIT